VLANINQQRYSTIEKHEEEEEEEEEGYIII